MIQSGKTENRPNRTESIVDLDVKHQNKTNKQNLEFQAQVYSEEMPQQRKRWSIIEKDFIDILLA